MRHLEDRADDAYAPSRAISDARDHERLEAEKARAWLNQVEWQTRSVAGQKSLEPVDGAGVPLVEARARVARHEAEVARLTRRYDEIIAIWRPQKALIQNLEHYLADISGTLMPHNGAQPKLAKGESAAAAVERLRGRVEELLAARRAVESAPWPSSVCKAKAREWVEQMATAGRPDVLQLVEHLGDIVIPDTRATVHGDISRTGVLDIYYDNATATDIWLHKDRWIEELNKEISKRADDAHALTAEQRLEKITALDGELLKVEREETYHVNAGGGQHRVDVDPRALLQLASSCPAPNRD
jgi:hypothetical protein